MDCTKEKIINFFDREYVDAKRFIKYLRDDDPRWRLGDGVVIDQTLQRMLGVAQFVQTLGFKYEEIDTIYEEYRKKVENLMNEEV